MIKLYYTGSTTWKESQTLSSKSIGGFISKTTIQNGEPNSLFQDLGEIDLWKDKVITNYIGVAAYVFFFDGENASDYKDFIFKLDYDSELEEYKDLFEFSVAMAPLAGDETSGIYMEQLRTMESKPFYTTPEGFQSLIKNEPVRFKKLSTNGIGIWLCRKFNPIKAKELFACGSDYWLNHEQLPSFNFDLNLSITIEEPEDGTFNSTINLDKIHQDADIPFDNYVITIINDNVKGDSKTTGQSGEVILKVNNYAENYSVLVTKQLDSGFFSSTFKVSKEQLQKGLTLWIDNDGKVYYKYIQIKSKELFLFDTLPTVDFNNIYSNSFWVCFVNDEGEKKI